MLGSFKLVSAEVAELGNVQIKLAASERLLCEPLGEII